MSNWILLALELMLLKNNIHATEVEGNDSGRNQDVEIPQGNQLLSPPMSYGSGVGVQMTLTALWVAEAGGQRREGGTGQQQALTLKMEVKYTWRDTRLSWKVRQGERDADAPDRIRLFHGDPRAAIWRPRVRFAEATQQPTAVAESFMQLSRTGGVKYRQFLMLDMHCAMSQQNFPFDQYSCPLTLYCLSCYDASRRKRAQKKERNDPLNKNDTIQNDDTALSNSTTVTVSYMDFDADRFSVQLSSGFKVLGGGQFSVQHVSTSMKDKTPVLLIKFQRRGTYPLMMVIGLAVVILLVCFTHFFLQVNDSSRVLLCILATLGLTAFTLHLEASGLLGNRADESPSVLLCFLVGVFLICVLMAVMAALVLRVSQRGGALASQGVLGVVPRPSRCTALLALALATLFCMFDTTELIRKHILRKIPPKPPKRKGSRRFTQMMTGGGERYSPTREAEQFDRMNGTTPSSAGGTIPTPLNNCTTRLLNNHVGSATCCQGEAEMSLTVSAPSAAANTMTIRKNGIGPNARRCSNQNTAACMVRSSSSCGHVTQLTEVADAQEDMSNDATHLLLMDKNSMEVEGRLCAQDSATRRANEKNERRTERRQVSSSTSMGGENTQYGCAQFWMSFAEILNVCFFLIATASVVALALLVLVFPVYAF